MPRRPAGRGLQEPEALHALAHPLRVRILEQLREPASAAEIAPRLSQSRQNVNYHLKELARGRLVRRVGERRSGGFVETLYQAEPGSVIVTSEGPVTLADCDSAVGETGELVPRAGHWQGVVHSLHLAATGGAPMETVAAVRVVDGRGVEGDRYFSATGTFSAKPGTGRHVTLIELEALAALRRESGIELGPAEARRNVVTCGVPLNHLIGREFKVGGAVLRGMRLCDPCTYLGRLTGKDVKPGLIHRGGLRADVIEGGRIRGGDVVLPV